MSDDELKLMISEANNKNPKYYLLFYLVKAT
jgi:hypothetical protein